MPRRWEAATFDDAWTVPDPGLLISGDTYVSDDFVVVLLTINAISLHADIAYYWKLFIKCDYTSLR